MSNNMSNAASPISAKHRTVSGMNVYPNSNNSANDLAVPWNIYIHKMNSNDWSFDSYKKISTMHTVDHLISFLNITVDQDILSRGMFFIMKDDCRPITEDYPNGGYISIKLLHNNKWKNYNADHLAVVINTMIEYIQLNTTNVCGFSLAHKAGSYVFKIWLKTYQCNQSTKILRDIGVLVRNVKLGRNYITPIHKAHPNYSEEQPCIKHKATDTKKNYGYINSTYNSTQ